MGLLDAGADGYERCAAGGGDRFHLSLHLPNFSVTAGVSGTVAILDPAVVNGGSVDTGSATILGGRHGVDVSQIAFGAQTTLAYAETGGTLTVGQRPPCCQHRATRQLHGGKLRRHGGGPRGRFHPGGAGGTAAAVDASDRIALGRSARQATEIGAKPLLP